MDRSSEILEKLEAIDAKVTGLIKWQAVHREHHRSIAGNLSKINRTIFANGGLRDKVMRLWNCKNDLTVHMSTWQSFYLYIVKALIVAGVIGLSALLLKIFKMVY